MALEDLAVAVEKDAPLPAETTVWKAGIATRSVYRTRSDQCREFLMLLRPIYTRVRFRSRQVFFF
jgi:hypothetical protein